MKKFATTIIKKMIKIVNGMLPTNSHLILSAKVEQFDNDMKTIAVPVRTVTMLLGSMSMKIFSRDPMLPPANVVNPSKSAMRVFTAVSVVARSRPKKIRAPLPQTEGFCINSVNRCSVAPVAVAIVDMATQAYTLLK